MVPQKLKHLIATAFTLLFSFLFVFHSHATTQAIQKQQDIPDCLIALSSGHAVVVDKGAQKFFVYHNGDNGLFNKVYESECSTGKNQGAKMVEGDGKTPEGIFFPTKLFAKNQLSSTYGSMAFHIDYPNLLDRKTGRDGNNIWIHGTNKPLCPFQSNGCITLTNKSIKRLFNYINLNKTPIIIEKSIKWIPQDARLDIKKSLEHLLDSWIKASNISFSMQAVDVSILRHGRSAVILFDQILSVNNISRHSGYKKLFLKENQGRWLIVGDEFQPPAAEKLFASTLSTLNRTAMDHEAIKKLIERWAKSWESGNVENYRSCYSPDFSARRMNLSNWISYKTKLRKRNKNIRICIEDIKISSGEERGLAVFTQEYNSSNYNATGIKKLRFKKIDGEWKIYRETWTARKE